MTDSLKERLRRRNGDLYMLLDEAIASIEELEKARDHYKILAEGRQATIAKLERDRDFLIKNARQVADVETIAKLEEENKQLRSELSGRLGQPFGDPAKS